MTSPNYAENNSVENMETKFPNMISRLKMRNVISFHKNVMTKMMATEIVQEAFVYSLEFPLTVIRAHATNFGVLATFQRTPCDLTMSIEVTMKGNPALKHRDFNFSSQGERELWTGADRVLSLSLDRPPLLFLCMATLHSRKMDQ